MKVTVIGLGYIGLPTCLVLAHNNFEVIGIDINHDVVNKINNAEPHIVEPGIDVLLTEAVNDYNFKAKTEPEDSDVFMICVPTPFHSVNNDQTIPQPNIDFVLDATDLISKHIKENNIVILESTSPVGTTEKIANQLKLNGVDVDKIKIAYCPERVLPGNIISELVENDRVVGGLTQNCTKAACKFYETFVTGNVLPTNARTAEMCKLTENSFRDVNIAFANELSVLCENLSINTWELIELANKHPRVNILNPGPGVGGHCISVDPWFIAAQDQENSKLIQTGRKVNLEKTDWVIENIKQHHKKNNGSKSMNVEICLLGLAFKPNVDDLRESPAITIANRLKKDGYSVFAVEPNIKSHDNFTLVNLEEAISMNSTIVALVMHDEFIQNKDDIISCPNFIDYCGLNK